MATKLYKKNCKRCDIELTLDNKWRDEALCVICGPIIKKERDKKHAPKRRLSERKWREKNRDKVAKYRERERENGDHYRRKYGLSIDEVNTLLTKGCQACGSQENLRVDHCHNMGEVRGCLCHGCNVALGFVREDSNRLRQLANYIDLSRKRWGCQGKKSVKKKGS